MPAAEGGVDRSGGVGPGRVVNVGDTDYGLVGD